MGTQTPWGQADYSRKIAPGIMEYGTPSHGGIHVSPTNLDKMPESWKNVHGYGAGWYEEDCDWALVCLAFPDVFELRYLENALGCAERWNADKMADFTPNMRASFNHHLSVAREVDLFLNPKEGGN